MNHRSSWERLQILIPLAAAFFTVLAADRVWAQAYLHPPAVETYATHDPAGVTAYGQRIKPLGSNI